METRGGPRRTNARGGDRWGIGRPRSWRRRQRPTLAGSGKRLGAAAERVGPVRAQPPPPVPPTGPLHSFWSLSPAPWLPSGCTMTSTSHHQSLPPILALTSSPSPSHPRPPSLPPRPPQRARPPRHLLCQPPRPAATHQPPQSHPELSASSSRPPAYVYHVHRLPRVAPCLAAVCPQR